MTGGTICIDRALFDHPVVGVQHPDMFVGWLWLIKEAGWQDRRKSIKGKTILVRRGQVAHSVRFIAEGLGWSIGKTQRFIKRLKTDTMIETATDTGQTVITICNYEKYQLTPGFNDTATDTANDTGPIRDRYGTDTNYNTLNNLNTLNTKKGGRKKNAKATRLPDTWEPDERGREYARSRGLDPTEELGAFRDHWLSKPRDNTKLDWGRTWQTWCRNAVRFGGGVSRGNSVTARRTPSEQQTDAARALLAERHGPGAGASGVGGRKPGGEGRTDPDQDSGPVVELFSDGHGGFSSQDGSG